MNYLKIINDIVSGEFDDMQQALDDRDIFFIRLENLDNLYANMSPEDQKKYYNIIANAVKIVEENL